MTNYILKPCPFCGGKASIVKNIQSNYFKIECLECHNKTTDYLVRKKKLPICYGVYCFLTENEAESKAVEAWNRRADECTTKCVKK